MPLLSACAYADDTQVYVSTAAEDHSDAMDRWRRGSVVRTSVCSWRTFPDLRLIHG